MALPKFWRDRGAWNDAAVNLSISLSLIGWLALSYHLRSWVLAAVSLVLGPITGFFAGFGVVAILCSYFCRRE
jgi:hypothetical protein